MQRHLLALSDEHLNITLNALADKPYRDVAPVIFEINRQLEARKPTLVRQTPTNDQNTLTPTDEVASG